DTTLAILRRLCEDTPRPLSEINEGIPDWLTNFINKLLSKDPSSRFQSAAEVAQLLEKCLAHVQRGVGVPPALVGWDQRAPAPAHQTSNLQPLTSASKSAISNPKSAIVWPLTAALLLFAAALLAAESTGLTSVTSSIIRIVRGDGTLVVEIDDPSIQVLLDG